MSSKPSVGKSVPAAVGDRSQSAPAPLYPIVKAEAQAMPARSEMRSQAQTALVRSRVNTELRSGDLSLSVSTAHGAGVARSGVSRPKVIPKAEPSNSIAMSAYPHGRGGMAGVSIPTTVVAPRVAGRSVTSVGGRPAASRMPAKI